MEDQSFRSKNQPPLDQAVTKNRFEGKVAVVMGGASGIGFATVERFANDGAAVAVVDIDRKYGEKAVEMLKAEGFEKVSYYYANATDKATCDAAVKAIADDNKGVLDYLINCAVNFHSRGLRSDSADWRAPLDVNVYGTVTMVQSCHPFMLKATNPAIVNLTSTAATHAQPKRWTYGACKGAVLAMTKHMALDLSKDNIRVNSVAPGWTWSPIMAKASPDGTLPSILPAVKDFTMLERAAGTSEVASVITFLCSRDASFITGSNVVVDGGYSSIGIDGHQADKLIASNIEELKENKS